MLGPKFLDLGIREKDRIVNRKLAIYEAWGKSVVGDKIERLQGQIEREELGEKPKDLIEAVYRNSLKEKKGNKLLYNEQSIFDEFRTFFFAGVDTTSAYLATMIFLIARDPEIERKVRAEIEEYMQTDDYSYENLKKFTYIENIQKETTRFYGPVNVIFLRSVETDFYLKDVLIKKGVCMRPTIIGVHYS